MNVNTAINMREMAIQELHDLPDTAMLEILDFMRFLKHQNKSLTAEERFDRLWLTAQRIASVQNITDEDIQAEVTSVRRGE